MGEVSVDRVADREDIREWLRLMQSSSRPSTGEKIAILQVRALVNLAETFDSYLKLQEMEARVRKLEEQLRG
jgi:hypothetical protein